MVYVRPVLEYNSVTWLPHLKQDIRRIEKVQRRFTKRLRGFKDLAYKAKVDLPSLELRRLHLDLIYCYKIVFGLVKPEFFYIFVVFIVAHQGACIQITQKGLLKWLIF